MAATSPQLNPLASRGRIRSRREDRPTPKDVICQELVRCSLEHFPHELRAVLLTGSLARNEATFVQEGGTTRALGDVEFILLFNDRVPLPRAAKQKALCYQIEYRLERLGIRCPVGLSTIHSRYLRRMKPHIYGYELRACGQVLWGDGAALSLIPAFGPADIPREDAWQMLCNRIVECLESLDEAREAPASPMALYRAAKLYLDMTTSYLVFEGAYQPTYRARFARLEELVSHGRAGRNRAFIHSEILDRVDESTNLKLTGMLVPTDGRGPLLAAEALRHALELWRWELLGLTHSHPLEPNETLWERWTSRQSAWKRLRGWLYVLREEGWIRSVRHWPRWIRLAVCTSPRYWLYAVAVEHAHRTYGHPGMHGPLPRWSDTQLARCLPRLTREDPADAGLTRSIATNYHGFLERTRA